ncbi:hypothetical protein ACLB2K_048027 [Fragaria x ananassa]
MKGVHFSATAAAFALLALATFHLVSASDPSSLQDFCVALKNTDVFVNGKFCKDPKLVTEDDFFFSGLRMPGNTSNEVGSKVTPANVEQIAGLNTLGISLARIDYAPNGGLNPPHTHPRASEFLMVMEGTLYVGFVTSNSDNGNKLFTKVLYPGDVFVFPVGLIHFQFNIGKVNAVAIAGLSSQNPGVITIANAVFGSKPPIKLDVLTKAFQVENNVVEYLQNQFWRTYLFKESLRLGDEIDWGEIDVGELQSADLFSTDGLIGRKDIDCAAGVFVDGSLTAMMDGGSNVHSMTAAMVWWLDLWAWAPMFRSGFGSGRWINLGPTSAGSSYGATSSD